ncbi:14904_t:CDS:2 [Rhizophagus irregularis]|nr:14904_t:CDS:2 [Rhizophagus irregularis]
MINYYDNNKIFHGLLKTAVLKRLLKTEKTISPELRRPSLDHHATELCDILINSQQWHPYLLVFTDSGSDHQLRFLRVQLLWIYLFIVLGLDYFVVVRTPPRHSWKNPVERIISILNLVINSDTSNTEQEQEETVRELFKDIFVNAKLSCQYEMEKPYYSAKCFTAVCFNCGIADIEIPSSNDTYPY